MNHTFSSVFDQPDERKIGRAFTVSLALHGAAFALVAWWMLTPPAKAELPPVEEYKVVFLEAPGPGGGGGGSPAPAAPRKIEIPKSAPTPTPVAPEPVPVTPPPPELVAPVQTNLADLMQSTGANALTLSAPPAGGGGQGTGIGPGKGRGVGPGRDAGFGDGAYQPGSGVEDPTLIHQVEPKYTSDAMRAKIQGVVYLEAVVLANGTVGDVRVVKSLDRSYGLDEKAIEAARGWLFRPGMRPDPVTKQRMPVAVIVRLELEFRLH